MNDSLKHATLSSSDTAGMAALDLLLQRAASADGQPPFNDQTLVDARTDHNDIVTLHHRGTLVGAAALGDETLELVIDPSYRRLGYGEQLTEYMLEKHGPRVLTRVLEPFVGTRIVPTEAWAHGNHPGAAHLAERHGFVPVRTLLQLRLPLSGPVAESKQPAGKQPEAIAPVVIDTFIPGRDDEAWVTLNARVFAGHPEQGRLTVDDLHARMAEQWFNADDFLIARTADGTMIGYNWLKISASEPGQLSEPGEIYVIGVDSAHAGQGLGRTLMQHGLNRLVARGCTSAALYVEEDNSPAVPLYRSLGFVDHTIDVLYARK